MHIGKQAVVIGAGIGGLTAARALVGSFGKIVVLERDVLPRAIESRPGVPQDRHPHQLLPAGLDALNDLFPGYTATMQEAGAKVDDIGMGVVYEFPGQGPMPARSLGISLLKASRPLIEGTLRRYVEREGDIAICDGRRVTEIVSRLDGNAVAAVRCETRDGAIETYDADLVIDASGRGEPTLALLRATGRDAPQETTIGVDFTYSTALVEFDEHYQPPCDTVLTLPDAPHSSRMGVLLAREDQYVFAGLGGRGENAPPADCQALLDFAATLPTQSIRDALRHAKSHSKVIQFKFPESRRKHFERYDAWPRGLIPIADAICRFNPVYGHGMTAASKEAVALRDLLKERQTSAKPLEGLFEAFMKAICPLLDNIWVLSAMPDLAYPDTRGERPDNLEEASQYNVAIHRAAYLDAEIHQRLFNVIALRKPVSEIQSEEVVEKVKRLAAEFDATHNRASLRNAIQD
jgi:2-polyprenyl-6-methoxyphenol hydroxylase-like FAD-dependent oxidoreductase